MAFKRKSIIAVFILLCGILLIGGAIIYNSLRAQGPVESAASEATAVRPYDQSGRAPPELAPPVEPHARRPYKQAGTESPDLRSAADSEPQTTASEPGGSPTDAPPTLPPPEGVGGGGQAERAPPQEAAPPPTPEPPQTATPLFPWPPPEASATYVLPHKVLAGADTLGDAANAILAALTAQGYVEHSFFATPNGIALVTRLERINDNGTRADPRWPSRLEGAANLIDYLKGLFFVAAGHYRLIVFIIQNDAFQQSGAQVSEKDAKAWLRLGLNTLPAELARQKFFGDCTALIYKFMSTGARVRLVDCELTGFDHLKLAGLQSLLGSAQ